MHRGKYPTIRTVSKYTFNSLYWDFCFASDVRNLPEDFLDCYSFNSLYWDFCFASHLSNYLTNILTIIFQFPLLGFLLCIFLPSKSSPIIHRYLSIPFIGIFALHLHFRRSVRRWAAKIFQFPLLGFLLCIPERVLLNELLKYNFQFPLLGFLLCISRTNNWSSRQR